MKWYELSFGLDLRSLALLRFALGLYTAADALQRMLEAGFYYSDSGVLPRATLAATKIRWAWSFHMFGGDTWWPLLLLTGTLFASLALAAGYRTGIFSVVVWALTVSLTNRNELVLDGGDAVHRLLLFWGMFVPLGAVWSLDALRTPLRAPTQTTVTSCATFALRVQMAFTFFIAALLKTGDPWRKTFDAVWMTLHYDVYVHAGGAWLRQFPDFLRWVTMATMVIEFAGPLVLFLPYPRLQVLAMLSMISLHIGFVLCMHLIMFSGIMIIGWLLFTPGLVWDRLGVPIHGPSTLRWPRLSLPPAARPWFEKWPLALRVFTVGCLLYVTAWNIRSLNPPRFTPFFPNKLNFIGYSLRIDQYWDMFSPSPTSEDGWLVVPAKLAGGFEIDLMREGAPVSWARPDSIADTYINRRGRKYFWSVTSAKSPNTRKQFGAYLCRAWSERLGEKVQSLEIFLMREMVQPNRTITAAERVPLWSQPCP